MPIGHGCCDNRAVVFILANAQDETLALTNFISRLVGPVESAAGTTSLMTQTVRGTQTMGRDYNRNRR